MPRRNRVLPTGEIVAVAERGLLMGNRGCLHDPDGRIVRGWTTTAWICCVLSFRGRRRALMQPGRYTELFFLDEAVALAAGHRPCAECRRADYLRFRNAWTAAHGAVGKAAEMDTRLHAARIEAGTRAQRRTRALFRDLPDGAFALVDGAPHLVLGQSVRRFSFAGYGPARARPEGEATVLTPGPILSILSAGYAPDLHGSVREAPG